MSLSFNKFLTIVFLSFFFITPNAFVQQQSEKKNVEIVNKSAVEDAEAQSFLASIYQNEGEIVKNPQLSLYWLSKAASKNDENAIQILKEIFLPFQEIYSINVPLDEIKYWKLGYQNISSNEYLLEFVPFNETVDNWSEIFTVMFMANEILNNDSKSPITAVQSIKRELSNKFGDQFKLNTLQSTENDTIFESFIPPEKNYLAEYEIVRLVKSSKGFYRLSYAKKGFPIVEKEKEKWLSCIREASLIKLN